MFAFAYRLEINAALRGATENARNEISAPSKMQVGRENTRHENARNENSGKM